MLRFAVALALLALAMSSIPASADPGKPVAVRWWGQGMVSIETYWNLSVVIDPYHDNIGYAIPSVTGDLVLVTHEHSDHNNVEAVKGEPVVVHGLDSAGKVAPLARILDRLPNQDKSIWLAADAAAIRSTHEIKVTAIPAWHDNQQGADRGAVAMFLIEVDAVRIVHCGDLGQSTLTDEQLKAMGRVDVLLMPVGGKYTVDGRQAAEIVAQVAPRFAVPIHFKTKPLTIGLEPVHGFAEAVEPHANVRRATGNTLAVCTAAGESTSKTQVVVLNYEPWQPTSELGELLDRMHAACRASQQVFAPLSIDQMNFRPSNGTHTPRWNAEHMMGRELLFFSQIYSKRDPQIVPIDLNPAQMPDDYKAAHPNWSGAEEARQMERADAMVRRFAYLLDGVPLDEPAPGSSWTPRRLCEQMVAHYGEHTANVEKKFELPDWPRE